MKIKFFEKDGGMNPEAIYAGVYQFKIGLLGEDEKNYLPLYIGESYSMALRCCNHLYEVFHTDPTYFGLTEENLKNEKLQLIVDVYKGIPISEECTNSERDILLRNEEKLAIEQVGPLSQLSTSDNLKQNRVEVVQRAINNLLSK